MTLDLTPDQLLSTTRAVRKRLDLDRPVPRSLIEECVDLATQAPTGRNRQRWHFIVVTDPDRRRLVGDIFRRALTTGGGQPPTERDLPRMFAHPGSLNGSRTACGTCTTTSTVCPPSSSRPSKAARKAPPCSTSP
jgi:nitroreductase